MALSTVCAGQDVLPNAVVTHRCGSRAVAVDVDAEGVALDDVVLDQVAGMETVGEDRHAVVGHEARVGLDREALDRDVVGLDLEADRGVSAVERGVVAHDRHACWIRRRRTFALRRLALMTRSLQDEPGLEDAYRLMVRIGKDRRH